MQAKQKTKKVIFTIIIGLSFFITNQSLRTKIDDDDNRTFVIKSDQYRDSRKYSRRTQNLIFLKGAIKQYKSEVDSAEEGDEKKRLNSILKTLEDEFERELNPGMSNIFFRGIVGEKHRKVFEDIKVDNKNVMDGIIKGIMAAGTLSVGDFVRAKTNYYTNKIFGGILDRIEDFFTSFYRFIYHDSCEPFTKAEIMHWKTIVSEELKEMEAKIRQPERFTSRGRNELLKEFSTDIDGKNNQQINLWNDVVDDLSFLFTSLADEIEKRQGYYKEKEGNAKGWNTYKCGARIKIKLRRLVTELRSTNSLQKCSNIPEIKGLLTSLRKSFEFYCNNLIFLITPTKEKDKVSKTKSYGSSASLGKDSMPKSLSSYV